MACESSDFVLVRMLMYAETAFVAMSEALSAVVAVLQINCLVLAAARVFVAENGAVEVVAVVVAANVVVVDFV